MSSIQNIIQAIANQVDKMPQEEAEVLLFLALLAIAIVIHLFSELLAYLAITIMKVFKKSKERKKESNERF